MLYFNTNLLYVLCTYYFKLLHSHIRDLLYFLFPFYGMGCNKFDEYKRIEPTIEYLEKTKNMKRFVTALDCKMITMMPLCNCSTKVCDINKC